MNTSTISKILFSFLLVALASVSRSIDCVWLCCRRRCDVRSDQDGILLVSNRIIFWLLSLPSVPLYSPLVFNNRYYPGSSPSRWIFGGGRSRCLGKFRSLDRSSNYMNVRSALTKRLFQTLLYFVSIKSALFETRRNGRWNETWRNGRRNETWRNGRRNETWRNEEIDLDLPWREWDLCRDLEKDFTVFRCPKHTVAISVTIPTQRQCEWSVRQSSTSGSSTKNSNARDEYEGSMGASLCTHRYFCILPVLKIHWSSRISTKKKNR